MYQELDIGGEGAWMLSCILAILYLRYLRDVHAQKPVGNER